MLSYDKTLLNKEIWRFTDSTIFSILAKFKNSDKTLSDYTKSGVYRGILTGLNKAFIINTEKRNQLIQKSQSLRIF